jgi:TP901 family phage tail tape measure protein
MAQGLERLHFIVSLVDRVSRPLRAVQGRLASLNDQVERSTRHVTTGFLAGSGAVLGLVGALKPAIDHAAALREVASLGVETDNLALLSRAGMDYAARFGESATSFVRSAYDIQSAIAGLTGDELSRFTTAANITAKATKASAEEVTGFFGTMFGIFQKQADAMGRGAWVEALAGQTARAVQMFKTTGPQMSAAFANLGADATSMGLSMAEQFAVLGRLQATMGGSEAATKFRAFLRGVGKAQGELGLSFSDAQGRMLALPEILERLREKFGQIDTVAKSDMLRKAFGSDEAVALVKLLLADTEGLRGNIAAIESAGGLQAASQMADTMVDPFQRLQRVVENVAITWGSFLLPLITPYVEKLSAAGQAVRAWAERFPHLTRLLGLATVGVFGIILAVAALKIAVGLLGFALLPLRAGLMLLRAAVPVAVWLASTAAMLAWRGALLALQGVLLLAKVAVWAFNVALWLNPITWIVAAIVALIAVIALSVVYWDELKAAAGAAADWLLGKWRAVQAWFAGFVEGWVALFRGAVQQVAGFFAGLLGPDSLLGRLAGLAGLSFEGAGAAPVGTLGRRGGEGAVVPGAARAISNVASSTDNSRRLAIGTVNVTSSKRLEGHELIRQLQLAADG